jgi:hypothetical protein
VSETGVEAIEKGVAEPIVADAIIDRRCLRETIPTAGVVTAPANALTPLWS